MYDGGSAPFKGFLVLPCFLTSTFCRLAKQTQNPVPSIFELQFLLHILIAVMERWHNKKFCLALLVILVFLVTFIMKNVRDSETKVQKIPGWKYILLHSGPNSVHIRVFNESQISNTLSSCDVSNCIITRNSHLLNSISDFDAIIFSGRNLEKLKPSDVPDQKHRRMTQRYIFHLHESPINTNINYQRFYSFFNWTMTYRLDSDINSPHRNQYIMSKLARSSENTKMRRIDRPGVVAWMVSHCNTKSEREKYVNELMKHIKVDIFGWCSEVPTKYRGCRSCPNIIKKRYKFYLAFENSFCDDYVTEKLFDWLGNDIVPVVMGQADYAAITPPHSIINALDYPNPKYLAAYLNQLMDNDTEYLSYFRWKDLYVENKSQSPWCRLCEMLNDQQQPNKIYENLGKWWSVDSHCQSEGTYPWSKYNPLKKPMWRAGGDKRAKNVRLF